MVGVIRRDEVGRCRKDQQDGHQDDPQDRLLIVPVGPNEYASALPPGRGECVVHGGLADPDVGRVEIPHRSLLQRVTTFRHLSARARPESAVPDSRVDIRVQNVGDQGGQQHRGGSQQHHTLGNREVSEGD